MAEKRSLVAAVLIGTAASDIFTQDVEDLPDLFDQGEEPDSNSPRGENDKGNDNDVRMATGRQVNYIKSQLKKKRIAQKEFLEEWEDEFDSWDEIPFSQVNEILQWIAEQ